MKTKKVYLKVCPICSPTNCEEVVKTDRLMPKGKKRTTWLCYSCGAGGTEPTVK